MKSHWPVSILSTLASLIGMLTPLALVRILPPSDIGLFKIFFLYLILLPTLSGATGLFFGLSYWAGRKQNGPGAVSSSFVLVLLLGLISGALVFALRGEVASLLNWPLSIATVFSLGVFSAITASFYEEAAIASGRIWTGAGFMAGFEVLRALSILAAALLTRSLLPIFIAHTGVLTLKSVSGYVLGYRQKMIRFELERIPVSHVLRYALPVSLAWLFVTGINYSDQLILSRFLKSADFAFYSIGCLLVPPLTIFELSVTRVLIPRLSTALEARLIRPASGLYRRAVLELAYFLIPSVIGLMVFAGPIIALLFTDRYADSAKYLRLYALWYATLIIPGDAVPRARGEGGWVLRWSIMFGTITLGLTLLLTWKWGPFGALVGLLVSKILSRLYTIRYTARSTGWSYAQFLPLPEMGGMAAIAIILGAAALLLRNTFTSPLVWLVSCGSLFGVLYLTLTLLGSSRLRRQDQGTRVLMLTQHLGIGGLERMILNLSRVLSERTLSTPFVFVFDHAAYANRENNLVPEFEKLGIPVHTFSKGRGFSPKAVFAITRFVIEHRIDVIHSHDLGALIYGVLAKLATLNQVKLVHTQHSFVHLNRDWRYRWYERFFTLFVNQLTVVSSDTAAAYSNLGVPAERIHIIENGASFVETPVVDRMERIRLRDGLITEAAGRSSLKEFRDDFWLLYLARVHGRKGQDQALSLWKALAPELRDKTVLLFIGAETETGTLDRLVDGIRHCPRQERILYLGSTREPGKWLAASDVYLSCSEFEGMPLGPIEAAGSGLPLLLSEIPGHATLRGFSAQYPLGKPEQGADRLKELIARLESAPAGFHSDLWEKAASVREHHSMLSMARRYHALYAPTRETFT